MSVYELLPEVVAPNQCQLSRVALVAPGIDGGIIRRPGAVLRIVDDRTALPVRIVRLPAVGSCMVRIPESG